MRIDPESTLAGHHASRGAKLMASNENVQIDADDVSEYRGELKIGAVATAQTGLLPQVIRCNCSPSTLMCATTAIHSTGGW